MRPVLGCPASTLEVTGNIACPACPACLAAFSMANMALLRIRFMSLGRSEPWTFGSGPVLANVPIIKAVTLGKTSFIKLGWDMLLYVMWSTNDSRDLSLCEASEVDCSVSTANTPREMVRRCHFVLKRRVWDASASPITIFKLFVFFGLSANASPSHLHFISLLPHSCLIIHSLCLHSNLLMPHVSFDRACEASTYRGKKSPPANACRIVRIFDFPKWK